MLKKILSMLIVVTMVFSMLLLTGCHDDPKEESTESETFIVLSPKEKFLNTADAASTYFSKMKKALALPEIYKADVGKMEVNTVGIKLQELSMGDIPMMEESIGISTETTYDDKNHIGKAASELKFGSHSIPLEVFYKKDALLLNIDKVTEKILKKPIKFELEQIPVLYDEYSDVLMDSFGEELFTETKGSATVDGIEIANAETITFKATNKHFGESIKAVLQKAKTDLRVKEMLSFFNVKINDEDNLVEKYESKIDEAIEDLDKAISEYKDGDYSTITVINENDVLRSFSIVDFEENKEIGTINVTTTIKDGTNYVKGSIYDEGENVLEFAYDQKANDKGSADGNLVLTILDNEKEELDVSSEESEDIQTTSSEDEVITFNPDIMKIEVNFNGEKNDKVVKINSKIKITTKTGEEPEEQISLDVASEYETISETESKYKADLTVNVKGMDAKIVVDGSSKIVDYEAIEVPSDDKVEVIDENYDMQALVTKIMTEYPDVAEFIQNLIPGGGEYEGDVVGKTLVNDDMGISVDLYDKGYGSLYSNYYNIQYGDGKYTAETCNGTKVNGKYSVKGDKITIDGKSGFDYEEQDDNIFIENEDEGIYITVYEDKCCLQAMFTYTIKNNTISFVNGDGTIDKVKFVDNGDTIKIGEIEYTVTDLYDSVD